MEFVKLVLALIIVVSVAIETQVSHNRCCHDYQKHAYKSLVQKHEERIH
jgi:hypothetical protein